MQARRSTLSGCGEQANRRDDGEMMAYHRIMIREAPAALRNRAPLLEQLRRLLPLERERCDVLEVASGTGTHAAHFVAAMPKLYWQPTDLSPEALGSIEAHRADLTGDRMAPARSLDTTKDANWADLGPFDAVFCANMIHIAPWAAAEGLFRGAAGVLRAEGCLLIYGPFRFDGVFTAESNAAFDASLRGRDEAWGVRDVKALEGLARGLVLEQTVEMPANNHLLVWRKT